MIAFLTGSGSTDLPKCCRFIFVSSGATHGLSRGYLRDRFGNKESFWKPFVNLWPRFPEKYWKLTFEIPARMVLRGFACSGDPHAWIEPLSRLQRGRRTTYIHTHTHTHTNTHANTQTHTHTHTRTHILSLTHTQTHTHTHTHNVPVCSFKSAGTAYGTTVYKFDAGSHYRHYRRPDYGFHTETSLSRCLHEIGWSTSLDTRKVCILKCGVVRFVPPTDGFGRVRRIWDGRVANRLFTPERGRSRVTFYEKTAFMMFIFSALSGTLHG